MNSLVDLTIELVAPSQLAHVHPAGDARGLQAGPKQTEREREARENCKKRSSPFFAHRSSKTSSWWSQWYETNT